VDDSRPSGYFPSSKAEFAVWREQLRARGRCEALLFAMKCKADPVAIEAKIQEEEELISRHVDGPMAPGASPRIYSDAYIAGLREALRIIADAHEG
jgi:hypothetical protein